MTTDPTAATLPKGAVLVATDLGDDGAVALVAADAWAARLHVPMIAAHAVPRLSRILPMQPHLWDPVPPNRLREKAAAAIEAQIGASTKRAEKDYLIALNEGSPASVVIDLAEQCEPVLLVVGTHDKGSVQRWILGSTSEQIVRHAPCPVLVAREHAGDGPIVAATDLSDLAVPAIRAAAAEAKLRGRELVVVHAVEMAPPVLAALEPTFAVDESTANAVRSAAEEAVKATVQRVGESAGCQVVLGEPVDAITKVAKELDAPLVVVASHGHTDRFALGSVAEGIVRSSASSVLVTRRASK